MKKGKVIIACQVMKPELDSLAGEDNSIEIRYLEYSLHERPKKMPQLLQEQIDIAEKYASQIVLGYGLCSNGVVGLRAPKQGLIIPKVHDCISLFLGSREAYDKIFRERPGTYYLTPGWVEAGNDPLGYMERDYVPKMGREMAEWGIKEELKNYSHIVLINTKSRDMEPFRKVAKENAAFLGKEYEEISGSEDYFRKILFGPYDKKDFVILQPGEVMQLEMIL